MRNLASDPHFCDQGTPKWVIFQRFVLVELLELFKIHMLN